MFRLTKANQSLSHFTRHGQNIVHVFSFIFPSFLLGDVGMELQVIFRIIIIIYIKLLGQDALASPRGEASLTFTAMALTTDDRNEKKKRGSSS